MVLQTVAAKRPIRLGPFTKSDDCRIPQHGHFGTPQLDNTFYGDLRAL